MNRSRLYSLISALAFAAVAVAGLAVIVIASVQSEGPAFLRVLLPAVFAVYAISVTVCLALTGTPLHWRMPRLPLCRVRS